MTEDSFPETIIGFQNDYVKSRLQLPALRERQLNFETGCLLNISALPSVEK
jgi:hypothetical protein